MSSNNFYTQLFLSLSKPLESRDEYDLDFICTYLRSLEALADLRDPSFHKLASIARLEHHERLDILFQKGEACSCWYILVCGAVLLGDTMFLPRSTFGTRSLGPFRHQDCQVATASDFIVIDYSNDEFVRACSRRPSYHITYTTRRASRTAPSTQPGTPRAGAKSKVHLMRLNSYEMASIANAHVADIPLARASIVDADQDAAVVQHTNAALESVPIVLVEQASIVGLCSDGQRQSQTSAASGSASARSSNDDGWSEVSICALTTAADCDEMASSASGSGDEEEEESRWRCDEENSRRNSLPPAIRALLEKEGEKTVKDVEMLLIFVQPLAAFARQPYEVRRALCQRMVIVDVDKAYTTLIEDGKEPDSWSVLLSGSVEVVNGDDRRLLSVGDAVGLGTDSADKRGLVRTLTDNCLFLCVMRAEYERTMSSLQESRVIETDDTGRIVLVKKRCAGPGPITCMIVRATSDRLLSHLIEEHSPADSSFVDDFLLTHRVFIDSSLSIFEKLMDWYREPVLRDRVIRIVLHWLNAHPADFKKLQLAEAFVTFERRLVADGYGAQLALLRLVRTRTAQDNEDLLDLPSTGRTRLGSTSSSMRVLGNANASRVPHDSVIRVYKTEQTYKYFVINRETPARQVVDTALNEFGCAGPEHSLCEVSVESGGVIRQKRLPDATSELADRLPLNARYFVKANERTEPLVTDDATLVSEMLKDTPTCVLQFSALELARGITLEDFDTFAAVPHHQYIVDLFELDKPSAASNGAAELETCDELHKFAELVETERYWTVTEILTAKTLAVRARILKHFIKMARLFKQFRNYNSMFAVLSGLLHHAVSRLKDTWDRLSSKYKRIFAQLQGLLDPTRNHANYRELLRSSGVGVTAPTIPMYPLNRKDLVNIHLGNSTVVEGLINFDKMRLIGREVRHITAMSSISYDSSAFDTNDDLPRPTIASAISLSASAIADAPTLLASMQASDISYRRKRTPQRIDAKRMYEEYLSLRRVRLYLSTFHVERDETRLIELSYAIEAPSKAALVSLSAIASPTVLKTQQPATDAVTPRSSSSSAEIMIAPSNTNASATVSTSSISQPAAASSASRKQSVEASEAEKKLSRAGSARANVDQGKEKFNSGRSPKTPRKSRSVVPQLSFESSSVTSSPIRMPTLTTETGSNVSTLTPASSVSALHAVARTSIVAEPSSPVFENRLLLKQNPTSPTDSDSGRANLTSSKSTGRLPALEQQLTNVHVTDSVRMPNSVRFSHAAESNAPRHRATPSSTNSDLPAHDVIRQPISVIQHAHSRPNASFGQAQSHPAVVSRTKSAAPSDYDAITRHTSQSLNPNSPTAPPHVATNPFNHANLLAASNITVANGGVIDDDERVTVV